MDLLCTTRGEGFRTKSVGLEGGKGGVRILDLFVDVKNEWPLKILKNLIIFFPNFLLSQKTIICLLWGHLCIYDEPASLSHSHHILNQIYGSWKPNFNSKRWATSPSYILGEFWNDSFLVLIKQFKAQQYSTFSKARYFIMNLLY